MNILQSEKVKETRFYIRNNLKHIMFYVFSVCTLGIVYIIFKWYPELKVKLYNQKNQNDEYTFILVLKHDGDQILVKVYQKTVRVLPNQPLVSLKYLLFENQIYYLDEQVQQFRHIETIMKTHLSENPRNFLETLNGLDEKTVAELITFYGENIIEIKDKPYFFFLIEDLFSPLILFQMITCVVFSFIGYHVFGIIILIITVFTAMTMAYERLLASEKMKAIAEHEAPVKVSRNHRNATKEMRISSRQLVIGDIVRIQNGDLFTVDMIIVKGSCLVSEAVLTGEANPVRKSGIIRGENLGSFEIVESNLIHCGSNCIMNKSDLVEAIVIRTGWSTSKGELVSNIINSKPVEFKFRNDVYKILLALFCVGLFFVVVLLFVQVNYGTFLWSKFLDKSLEILTVALPPALILSFTVGIKAANTNLKEKKILPIIIDKINEAGRVKFICFDKTGTLTENNVKIGGFILDADFVTHEISYETTELINSPNYLNLMETMGCCHSLQMINEVVAGDPLDEEMFFKTKFVLHEIEVMNDCKRYIKPTKEFRKLMKFEPDFKYQILHTNEFTPERKRMSVITSNNYGKGIRALIKGAPESIKGISRPDTLPENYESVVTEYSQKGYRIIALAVKEFEAQSVLGSEKQEGDQVMNNLDPRQAEVNVHFIGFVLLNNPLKLETKEVIEKLKNVDIQCKMITGDNIYTSLNVACASGILETYENIFLGVFNKSKNRVKYIYFTSQELKEKITISGLESSKIVGSSRVNNDTISRRQINRKINCNSITEVLFRCKEIKNTKIAMDGEAYEKEISHNPEFNEDLLDDFFEYAIVFSRSSPKQKESIVEKLKNTKICKKNIYCVAFVGDGSNDSKALRVANVGLSLGTNESSIASSFNTKIAHIGPIIDVLIEGRANLELSIQNFKFIMITGIFQFFSITCLSFYNLDYNTGQYLLFDVFTVIPLALFMCRTKAVDELNKNIPRVSIINIQILSSIGGHLVLCMLFLVVVVYVIFYTPLNKTLVETTGITGHFLMDEFVFPQNNLMIFFVDVISISACFAVNHAYPFRKTYFTNLLFCLYGIFWISFHFLFVFALEIDFFYFSKFLYKFGLVLNCNKEILHFFVAFTIMAAITTYIFERMLNSYFLIKKRELNKIVAKQKSGNQLSEKEKEMMNALFELVSMN